MNLEGTETGSWGATVILRDTATNKGSLATNLGSDVWVYREYNDSTTAY